MVRSVNSGFWGQYTHQYYSISDIPSGQPTSNSTPESHKVIKKDQPLQPHGSDHFKINVWAPQTDHSGSSSPNVHCQLYPSDRFPSMFHYNRRCANVGSSFDENFSCRGSCDKTSYHTSWNATVHLIVSGVDGRGNPYNSSYVRKFASTIGNIQTTVLEGTRTEYINCSLQQMWDYDELN